MTGRRTLFFGLMWASSLGGGTGCLDAPGTRCASGLVCPPDTLCDEARNRCVLPSQAEACAEAAEGADCRFGETSGLCRDGVCVALGCGDGDLRAPEECDGENLGGETCVSRGYYQEGTGLACNDDCTFDESGCAGACGDAKKNGEELCDGTELGDMDCTDLGFYDAPGLTCTPFCTFDVSGCTGFCGDGIVNGDEEQCDGAPPAYGTCVDFGFDAGALGCNAFCTPRFSGCATFGWQPVQSLTGGFDGLWGSGPDDLFALGTSSSHPFFHFDGSIWSEMSPPATVYGLAGLWGAAGDDVYAVGYEYSSGDGVVEHYDGSSWSVLDTGTLPRMNAVWGSGPDDVWAAARDGQVVHFDGNAWSASTIGSGTLLAIWGRGPDDVWAAGASSDVYHYDGDGWSPLTPSASGTWYGLWGEGDDLYFVGSITGESAVLHYDGSWALETIDPGPPLYAVWGSGEELFAAGQNGLLVRSDGRGVWSRMESGTPSTLRAIWGSAPSDVYAAGFGGIVHYEGNRVATIDPDPSSSAGLVGLWGFAADDLFALGSDLITQRFDGAGWTEIPGSAANGVWGAAPNDLYSVGFGGHIAHFDGSSWSDVHTGGAALNDVWGSGPRDVFAVGEEGTVLHYGGTGGWDSIGPATTAPFDRINAVWGTGPNDVFAAGSFLWHYDGDSWTESPLGTVYFAVAGTGPNDVFVGGGVGQIGHYDGTDWTVMTQLPTDEITSLWALAPDDVFAGGSGGALFHYDGAAWSPVRTGTEDGLYGAWGTPRDLYFTDEGGLITHLRRLTPWHCQAAETHCGDGVDNDCDLDIDARDPDCAGAVQLSEVHGGSLPYIELINETGEVSNLSGLTVTTFTPSCDAEPKSFTFPPDAIAQPGEVWRVLGAVADQQARERYAGFDLCATPDYGWAALCAGACDLVQCSNVLDYLEWTDGVSQPASTPPCASFSPAPVDASGAAAGDSLSRVDTAGGGTAGLQSDWAIAAESRD